MSAEPGRRRAVIVGATAVTGTLALGATLSATPGSRRFHLLTGATSAIWVTGGIAAGTPGLYDGRRPVGQVVAEAAAVGVASTLPFQAGARIARRIGPLRRMLTSILAYAHQGDLAAVEVSTIGTGLAEEVFFRGPVLDLFDDHATRNSTAVYVAVTCATRNPTLVLAAVPMGVVFAWQRNRGGGLLAPMVAHAAWSVLMLRTLPPLFPPDPRVESAGDWHQG